jgi:hypothetical protein
MCIELFFTEQKIEFHFIYMYIKLVTLYIQSCYCLWGGITQGIPYSVTITIVFPHQFSSLLPPFKKK